jgi:hypothetical protein
VFKLSTLMLASALLLASGCAEHEQRVALQQKCDNGDQNACQQIAANEAPPQPYPGGPNVRVFPSGQSALGGGSFGGGASLGGGGFSGIR